MDDRVCVKVFNYRHEAELARSALEARGIPCFISADDAGGQGIGIQFTNGVRLWVSPQDLEHARTILDASGSSRSGG